MTSLFPLTEMYQTPVAHEPAQYISPQRQKSKALAADLR
jgi:hypothetical protein